MKLLMEVNRTEVDNIEQLRNLGWSGVKISRVIELFSDGWVRCNKACRHCGAMQFFKDGKPKCLACGGR